MNTLKKLLDNINVFKPQTYENMTVVGLNIPENDNIDLMSLEIGLNMGLVEITESSSEGSVSEIKVINNAVTPLLILDGEEILGSKQNRIVNTTIIIPPKSEKLIPVSCTEAGRWNYNSKKFHYSRHMATSSVRRDKQNSVTISLRKENSFKSNQKKVWENISTTQKELGVSSQTRALHDSYTQKSIDIEDYKKVFTLQDNQNGLIVYINGKLVGFELIHNTTRYKQYHEKLVESYILDAIRKQGEEYAEEVITEKEFIKEIKEANHEVYPSVGLGEEYRIEDDQITGSAMLYNDNIINASFFKKLET